MNKEALCNWRTNLKKIIARMDQDLDNWLKDNPMTTPSKCCPSDSWELVDGEFKTLHIYDFKNLRSVDLDEGTYRIYRQTNSRPSIKPGDFIEPNGNSYYVWDDTNLVTMNANPAVIMIARNGKTLWRKA